MSIRYSDWTAYKLQPNIFDIKNPVDSSERFIKSQTMTGNDEGEPIYECKNGLIGDLEC